MQAVWPSAPTDIPQGHPQWLHTPPAATQPIVCGRVAPGIHIRPQSLDGTLADAIERRPYQSRADPKSSDRHPSKGAQRPRREGHARAGGRDQADTICQPWNATGCWPHPKPGEASRRNRLRQHRVLAFRLWGCEAAPSWGAWRGRPHGHFSSHADAGMTRKAPGVGGTGHKVATTGDTPEPHKYVKTRFVAHRDRKRKETVFLSGTYGAGGGQRTEGHVSPRTSPWGTMGRLPGAASGKDGNGGLRGHRHGAAGRGLGLCTEPHDRAGVLKRHGPLHTLLPHTLGQQDTQSGLLFQRECWI